MVGYEIGARNSTAAECDDVWLYDYLGTRPTCKGLQNKRQLKGKKAKRKAVKAARRANR